MTGGLWVIGGGGLARGAVDAARLAGQTIAGIVLPAVTSLSWFDGPVISEADFAARADDDAVVVAVGDNALRWRIADKLALKRPSLRFPAVVHPSVVRGERVRVADGAIVLASVTLCPDASIGRLALVYTGTIIEHDCVMGDHASTAPGVVMGGGVNIGAASFVGLGARIMHGRSIGSDTVIGMGAVVTRDLPDNVVAVGHPARLVRARQHGDRYL